MTVRKKNPQEFPKANITTATSLQMDPTDESRRKPRRTRGTPSYYYRNRFAYAVLAAGSALFLAFTFTPIYRLSNEKAFKVFSEVTEEEIERRFLFGFQKARTSRQVKEDIKENIHIREH